MNFFSKYQGAGNDFIIFDNRNGEERHSEDEIKWMCDRRFGIGADGLMYLESSKTFDFEMHYYNSDGRLGTMCGNGGRCIVQFAHDIKLINNQTKFSAIDGVHDAAILNNGLVALKMNDVHEIKKFADGNSMLDTGSPHYISFVKNIDALDVYNEGKKIRNLPQFGDDGINVNFIQKDGNEIIIRTYERGVEDETLACGTGITAAAIISKINEESGNYNVDVKAKGGLLNVSFQKNENKTFTDVVLTGPAAFVFKGEWNNKY